jgi:hypothetical protein
MLHWASQINSHDAAAIPVSQAGRLAMPSLIQSGLGPLAGGIAGGAIKAVKDGKMTANKAAGSSLLFPCCHRHQSQRKSTETALV